MAAFPVCTSADVLSKTADLALYAAKAAGQNQVIPASECQGNALSAVQPQPASDVDPSGLPDAALLQSLMRRVNSIIIRFDTKGIITFANQFAQRFFGFTETEMVGHHLIGTVFAQTSSNGATALHDYRISCRTRSAIAAPRMRTPAKMAQKVWVAWSNTPLLDAQGQTVEILCIGNDITARKQAEAELTGMVARLSALNRISQVVMNQQDFSSIAVAITPEVIDLFHAYHIGISLLDEDHTRLVFIGDLLGDWKETLDPGNEIVLADDQSSTQVLETGKALFVPNAMTSPLTVGSHDFLRTYQINGRIIAPLIYRGKAIGTLNIDFADPDRTVSPAEIELAETIGGAIAGVLESGLLFKSEQHQRQYYEALVSNLPTAVVMVNQGAKISSWNPAAVKMFGYTAEEALGQNIDDLLASEEYRQEAIHLTHNTLSESGLVQSLTRRRRKDGTLAEVELLAVPVFVEGLPSGSLAIYHDISELQRARHEAEAANEAKSAFLATMSHEIRTPLNAIIGMTSLLLDTGLTCEQQNFLETVRGSGDALLTIINDILDFSKIEAGGMEMEEQPFDLRECLESALDLVASKAAEKGFDVAYLLDPDVPAVIISDSARLRQILLNLLSNSLKFTEEGEVVLSVSAEKLPEGADKSYRLHFKVRDTGIGIPPDRVDRLFRSFSQVDASTTRKYGGTGLGLAISKRLAELMGGTMWVESEGVPGKGSTFHFTICANPSNRPLPVFMHRKQPELSGKRALIVDDNATNRYILMRQIQSWGMVPLETAYPRQALEWIREGQSFDILLLDMQMPEMNGVTLATEIRRFYGEDNELPIVMLTSLGLKEFDTASAKFASYLTKPIKPAALYATLLDVFGGQPVQPNPAAHKRPEAKAPADHLAPLHILLAEDNVVNQQVALHLLDRLGYRVDVAGNGLEVLEALHRQPYDVILMDVQMPEMDGLETTRQVRAGLWKDNGQNRRARLPAVYHRHDGQRHAGRPGGLPGLRHG